MPTTSGTSKPSISPFQIHEIEQRRREAASTTYRERLLWLDGALELAERIQRDRRAKGLACSGRPPLKW